MVLFSKWKLSLVRGCNLVKLKNGDYRVEGTRNLFYFVKEDTSIQDIRKYRDMCIQYGYNPIVIVFTQDSLCSTLKGSIVDFLGDNEEVILDDISLKSYIEKNKLSFSDWRC